jgi:hypothetical protein
MLQPYINLSHKESCADNVSSEHHVDRDWPSCNFRVTFHQPEKQNYLNSSYLYLIPHI